MERDENEVRPPQGEAAPLPLLVDLGGSGLGIDVDFLCLLVGVDDFYLIYSPAIFLAEFRFHHLATGNGLRGRAHRLFHRDLGVEIKSLFVSNSAQAGLAIRPDNNAIAKSFLMLITGPPFTIGE